MASDCEAAEHDGETEVSSPVPSDSCSYTKLSDRADVLPLRNGLYNGKVVLMASAALLCWSAEFDLASCQQELCSRGVQVPNEEFIQAMSGVLQDSEIIRYAFLVSKAFGIAIAMVLFCAFWGDFFSSFWHFLPQLSWVFSLLISLLIAVVIIGAVVWVFDRRGREMNINTDMRLAVLNEKFVKYKLVAGLTDSVYMCRSRLDLNFVYFDTADCLGTLAERFQPTRNAQRRESLDHLSILLEEEEEPGRPAGDSEEAPLLPSGDGSAPKKGKTITTVRHFTPWGSPEQVAEQLLVTYSAAYVKLLVKGLLYRPQLFLHAHDVPCLCQYIQHRVLHCPA
uniref:Transmembrane protein 268 n=1 Tax=Petromyzon marinus TaxID=7757 RepID=A0AAJ7TC56_PETMA|nr:transmembrane protein 268 [Petromyzon marinus]